MKFKVGMVFVVGRISGYEDDELELIMANNPHKIKDIDCGQYTLDFKLKCGHEPFFTDYELTRNKTTIIPATNLHKLLYGYEEKEI